MVLFGSYAAKDFVSLPLFVGVVVSMSAHGGTVGDVVKSLVQKEDARDRMTERGI